MPLVGRVMQDWTLYLFSNSAPRASSSQWAADARGELFCDGKNEPMMVASEGAFRAVSAVLGNGNLAGAYRLERQSAR